MAVLVASLWPRCSWGVDHGAALFVHYVHRRYRRVRAFPQACHPVAALPVPRSFHLRIHLSGGEIVTTANTLALNVSALARQHAYIPTSGWRDSLTLLPVHRLDNGMGVYSKELHAMGRVALYGGIKAARPSYG
jgi:hypothetical protein